MINDMGITVYETAPDADDLLNAGDNTADELAAEEAAAALAAVETDAGRRTDPVRMYMREMGTVELLTREGEIAIAKRIEEGIRDMLTALAEFPGTVDYIIETYDEVRAENKLADLFIGYLDPTEHVPQAPQVDLSKKDETKDDDSEEEEVDRGPDPEEAKRLFHDYQELMKIGSDYGKFDREGKKKFIETMEALMSRYKVFMKRFELSEDFQAKMTVEQLRTQLGIQDSHI